MIEDLTPEENEEFNRLELESNVRKMAVNAALQKLHDVNEALGLYKGVYPLTDDELKALNDI